MTAVVTEATELCSAEGAEEELACCQTWIDAMQSLLQRLVVSPLGGPDMERVREDALELLGDLGKEQHLMHGR